MKISDFVTFDLGNSLDFYSSWNKPIVIVSDGPYGVNGYDGDLSGAEDLPNWYEPHIQSWSDFSSPLTTLWFWNTEVGWAEVHPVLKKYGWIYRSCNIWDKGIEHVSGNTNSKTLRRFPVVTEVCVHYVRSPRFVLNGQNNLSAQDWLRSEWQRTKLHFNIANKACSVKNAATRKYLTTDHCWYFPPADVFEKLSQYANEFGDESGKPYFAINGNILTGSQWEQLRAKFYCPIGITNVWKCPPIRGNERIKGKSFHPSQKPFSLMERIIKCSSDEGDIIWEPFGGLCSASIAALRLKRKSFAAEINEEIYKIACERIKKEENYEIMEKSFE